MRRIKLWFAFIIVFYISIFMYIGFNILLNFQLTNNIIFTISSCAFLLSLTVFVIYEIISLYKRFNNSP